MGGGDAGAFASEAGAANEAVATIARAQQMARPSGQASARGPGILRPGLEAPLGNTGLSTGRSIDAGSLFSAEQVGEPPQAGANRLALGGGGLRESRGDPAGGSRLELLDVPGHLVGDDDP